MKLLSQICIRVLFLSYILLNSANPVTHHSFPVFLSDTAYLYWIFILPFCINLSLFQVSEVRKVFIPSLSSVYSKIKICFNLAKAKDTQIHIYFELFCKFSNHYLLYNNTQELKMFVLEYILPSSNLDIMFNKEQWLNKDCSNSNMT